MTPEHDRRTMLKATGATLAVAPIAGCLAGGQIGSKDGQTADDEVKADVTIAVGPGGNLTFAPENVTVHPGQTVAWVWKSDTHNVAVEDQPDDANWKGTPGPVSEVYDRDTATPTPSRRSASTSTSASRTRPPGWSGR